MKLNELAPRHGSVKKRMRIGRGIGSGMGKTAKSLDASAVVDAAALIKAGLIRREKDGVRLLGNGQIKAKVQFEVYGASKPAVEAVEKAGGSVKILAPKPEEGEKAA